MRNMNTKVNERDFNFVQVTYNPHNRLYGFNYGNDIIDCGFSTFEEAEADAKAYADENNLDYVGY